MALRGLESDRLPAPAPVAAQHSDITVPERGSHS